MTLPKYATLIRMNYVGDDTYSVTWEEWPSVEATRTKRQTFSAGDVMGAATIAADTYAEWASTPPNMASRIMVPKCVTVGRNTCDNYIVSVTVDYKD